MGGCPLNLLLNMSLIAAKVLALWAMENDISSATNGLTVDSI